MDNAIGIFLLILIMLWCLSTGFRMGRAEVLQEWQMSVQPFVDLSGK